MHKKRGYFCTQIGGLYVRKEGVFVRPPPDTWPCAASGNMVSYVPMWSVSAAMTNIYKR